MKAGRVTVTAHARRPRPRPGPAITRPRRATPRGRRTSCTRTRTLTRARTRSPGWLRHSLALHCRPGPGCDISNISRKINAVTTITNTVTTTVTTTTPHHATNSQGALNPFLVSSNLSSFSLAAHLISSHLTPLPFFLSCKYIRGLHTKLRTALAAVPALTIPVDGTNSASCGPLKLQGLAAGFLH